MPALPALPEVGSEREAVAPEHPVAPVAGGGVVGGGPDRQAVVGGGPDRQTLATAVRYTLQLLAERAKGNTVEVRVPPFGAVQCIEGPGHTRGTPPNVVETDAQTWLALVTGSLEWMPGVESGRIHASGQRADLRGYIPLTGLPRPVA
ncbi:sterol carrier family protein [Subtercola endophyticus]|uniref:sterol carrier family protein n=1 Tax=Subtercola endophyticus TaxID=2895559 RepID=UPI0036F24C48